MISIQDYKLQQGKFWLYIREKSHRKGDQAGTSCPERLWGLHSWRFPGFDWRRPWANSSNFEASPALSCSWTRGICSKLFHSNLLFLSGLLFGQDLSHLTMSESDLTRRWQNEQTKEAKKGLSGAEGVLPACLQSLGVQFLGLWGGRTGLRPASLGNQELERWNESPQLGS